MPNLKEQHLEAIRDNVTINVSSSSIDLGGIDHNSRNEAAEACTAITEAAMEGFAEWIMDNNWHRMNKDKWYQHICPDYLTTAELRHLYNNHLNK